jgi:hypothetical protein
LLLCWANSARSSTLLFTLTFRFHLPNTEPLSLTTHLNAGTNSLTDLLQKPLQDGRGAKTLGKEQLKTVRDALTSQALRWLLPVLHDPRTADYEIPEKKLAPAHPSLPARPSFAAPVHDAAKRPLDAEEDRPNKRHRLIPLFLELDAQAVFTDQLRGSVVIEWPVLEIWFGPDLEKAIETGQLEVRQPAKAPAAPVAVSIKAEAATSGALAALGGYGSESQDDGSDAEAESAEVAQILLVG